MRFERQDDLLASIYKDIEKGYDGLAKNAGEIEEVVTKMFDELLAPISSEISKILGLT